MKELVMNERLLSVLTALKQRQALAITESSLLDGKEDWLREIRAYFASLPKSLIEEVGLVHNENCIRAIERFEIPEVWNTTPFEELNQFTFKF